MNKILKIVGIIVLIVIIGIASMAGYVYYRLKTVKDTHDLRAQADAFCSKFMSKQYAPGLAIAVIKDNKVYVRTYGYANKEGKILVDSNTIFEIGSVTKVFTAEMTQLLADKGILGWNDPIQQDLPDAAKLPMDDGTKLLHLASHTAGFPRVPDTLLKAMKNECNPYNDLTEEQLNNYLKHCTDKRKPELDNYDYSNIGAGLLGYILVYKSGKPYDTLLQELVCRPLGLLHTSLYVNDSSKFADGYDEKGKKTCHWNFPVLYGCGAIRSDIADMVRFVKANMDEQNPLYPAFKKTQQQIARIPMGGIAYGWHIDKANGALSGIDQIIWHNGGTGGFRTYIGFIPSKKAGVIVLANRATEEVDALGVDLIKKAGITSFEQ